MKKEDNTLIKFNSLSDAHRYFGIEDPKHPLISLVKEIPTVPESNKHHRHILGFYKISYKPKLHGRVEYGQGYYDFDQGGLLFAAPGQIVGTKEPDVTPCSEYTLLIHPDFLLGYPLAKKIKQYGFFSYSVKETLHLSEEEKNTIYSIFSFIQSELDSRIDDLSQDVMISQIELLLSYANRFYKRQFITRKAINNDLLQKFEAILDEFFEDETALNRGLPTVSYFAEKLNLSSSYLSDMLRTITGQSTQQHIHDHLILKAKEILSTTTLSVGEVAYALGFEHSQSFSQFFKTKTNLSPLEFRKSFN
ncbi:helix-turn-helix domain-containing protein [Flavobacterium sp.]|uniref:helix-turn-helix domain-containing protein n=1 Tax=Flavobacterium sp. TaxID=239 RepID=UPI002C8302A3|nr:helix-turn-helix domain-containing protein [Flavobacterium sp.]HSD09071.1 helix-turn-helix domain-containing protein [Flavobacterium sp.]